MPVISLAEQQFFSLGLELISNKNVLEVSEELSAIIRSFEAPGPPGLLIRAVLNGRMNGPRSLEEPTASTNSSHMSDLRGREVAKSV